MNKLVVPLTIAVAITIAIPTGARADGPPSVNASIDCATFNIHVEGLVDGDRLVVEMGSNPPLGFVMGSGVYWQFAVSPEGTADAVLASSVNPWFDADVLVVRAGKFTNYFHEKVDCSGTAPEVDPNPVVVAEPEPVVEVKPVMRPRRVEMLATRKLHGAW